MQPAEVAAHAGEYFPAGQELAHKAPYVPPGQAEQVVAPATEYVPSVHEKQLVDEAVGWKLPAAQLVQLERPG